MRRLKSSARILGKGLVYLTALVLILVGIALAVVETGWAKNEIRALIVAQANQYLTARLEIGRLEGSLLRGLQLGDIRLSRQGEPIITIDEISLSYSLRELWQSGTVIQRIRLTRPHIVGARQPDGRWNLGALVNRTTRREQRSGPGRPIEIVSVEVVDGTVLLRDPLQFGAAHVPTAFEHLNATFSFAYHPVDWTLHFANASWAGRDPDLTMTKLSGGLGNGAAGWTFDRLRVQTPDSTFTLDGAIQRNRTPTVLDLHVQAERFAFQEWGGILRGLRNIGVTASFETTLRGPGARLDTTIALRGTGGSVNGKLVLDTHVPGWHGAGTVDVGRLDLARWLSKPDKASDITGRVTFDLDLDLGGHFPRGTYVFNGPHAAFMGYAGDQVRARGRLTRTQVQIAQATAVAYGAAVTANAGSTIGIDTPFPFRFQGTVAGIDLRRVPASVPVPRVESALTFDYDVTGQFVQPYIVGRAAFQASGFLGASVGAGTTGSIDTRPTPLVFAGEGEINGVNLHRFGQELDIGWMQAPRYAGVVSGHFFVQGAGVDLETLRLTGGGRLTRAVMFHGALFNADVAVNIGGGDLTASYDGSFIHIDPGAALDDPRFGAALTGSGRIKATVRHLVTGTPELTDYDIDARTSLEPSTIRGIGLDRAAFQGILRGGVLQIAALDVQGASIAGRASGAVAFTDAAASALDYNLSRLDLRQLETLGLTGVQGIAATAGRMSGRFDALRLTGDATITQLAAPNLDAPTVNGNYDVTIPSGDVARAQARVTAHAAFPVVLGQPLQHADGTVTMNGERIGFDAMLARTQGPSGGITGNAILHADHHAIDLAALTLTIGRAPWRLERTAAPPPTIAWTDREIAVQPLVLLGGAGDQRVGVSGTWRRDGTGALQVTATHVFLDSLTGPPEQPVRYGGIIDAEATIRGTLDAPRMAARVAITNGRVRRVSYQQLAGRIDYAGDIFTIDLRLDQAPGVWLTAAGTLPLALFRPAMPERPINVAIASSRINLGLVEGLTDAVRSVSGDLQIDVTAIGTSRDPHFQGQVSVVNAGFLVAATGARYKNASASVRLARERITVDALHMEDSGGRPLDVHGSLGTHELRVGDLQIDATARHFEVLHNEFGRIDIDAALQLRGRFETPRFVGNLTISSGDVQVDRILESALSQPYSTQPAAPLTQIDMNPAQSAWQRLALDVALHVPNSLKLVGDNVQVAAGTPLGLGNINLRVAGDLYLYKGTGEPISVTGSFDSLSGRYSFQGRQFDVDESSSINFVGDLNPDLYVTVTRVISGVETRVTINGPMRQPELHLASTPPLDSSDILSLIVFNTSANQLSSAQQQELAVRAGTLAAGFLATPIVTALQNELNIDILQIEPSGDFGVGPKLTVGEEIAPGLVARFSRQFGPEPYDEATVEYYISRLFRLRATFSDAQSLSARAPFRRVERAGIDLLLFFSF